MARLQEIPPRSTVLPHKFIGPPGTLHYDWYALAFNARALGDLQEALQAFIGPTHAVFVSLAEPLSLAQPSAPIEAAVRDLTGGLAFKLSGHHKEIWLGLERLRRVWEQRQTLNLVELSPPASTLRGFRQALQVGAPQAATATLDKLRELHGVDEVNLAFLRVQMLAELGHWQELLAAPELPDLLRVPRPLAVTQALITAVYHQELAAFETRHEAQAAQRHFCHTVQPLYGRLFTTYAATSAPAVIKSFALAMAGTASATALFRELRASPQLNEAERRYLSQLEHLAAV